MRKIALLVGVFAIISSNPSWALEARFTNGMNFPVTIQVQGNKCVTYKIQDSTHTLPAGLVPPNMWVMNLGDRNTGGCSSSYMLAWGIYKGTSADPNQKIGDINFSYQSGLFLKTYQNKTNIAPGDFNICSFGKQYGWKSSYVRFQLGSWGKTTKEWNCITPVN